MENLSENQLLSSKILIMDDEDSIRLMMKAVLGRLGYNIIATKDGREAVEICRETSGTTDAFDLIVLDLTVPGGMGGESAAQKIREFDKNIKVVASSGDANSPIMSSPAAYGFNAVIAKPYRIQELQDIILTVLQGNGNSSPHSS